MLSKNTNEGRWVSSLAVGDLDSDGDLDVIFTSYDSDSGGDDQDRVV